MAIEIDELHWRSLTGHGDCAEHYHLVDRQPTHDTSKRIQELMVMVSKDDDYTAMYNDDYILVDTTAKPITITLPLARAGFTVTILRTDGANNVTVAASGSDTVNGAASVTISSSYVPQTFKALPATISAGYVRVA